LVLPVSGKNRIALDSLGADRTAVDAALKSQRFEADSGSGAELFMPAGTGVRRLIVVGTGNGTGPSEAAEKLGGALVGRLLISGEKQAVLHLSGLNYDADSAARVALAAALRAWRYDRYRTKLKDKQKPTLTELTIVGAPADSAGIWEKRGKPDYGG